MHRSIPMAGALALALPLLAIAQQPPLPSRELPRRVPPVIGTHQIDRYDAISRLEASLKANPNALADWVILGELAHEVALDAPPDQAGHYFTLSRQAYEKALALSPKNAGLKAAVQFARDREANGGALEKSRGQATQTYLDARRRDLAATNYAPTIRTFTPPPQMPIMPNSPENGAAANATADPNPAASPPTAATANISNYGTRQFYSAPVYQPYTLPQGTPYTFQQYAGGVYPSGYYGGATSPVTIQRYVDPLFNPLGPQAIPGTTSIPATNVVPTTPAAPNR